MRLIAQQALIDLRVSAYLVDEWGRERQRVIDSRPVAGGSFSPGERIRIPLDGLEAGRYRVVVNCHSSRYPCREETYDILLGA
jgi:hypothetical protein